VRGAQGPHAFFLVSTAEGRDQQERCQEPRRSRAPRELGHVLSHGSEATEAFVRLAGLSGLTPHKRAFKNLIDSEEPAVLAQEVFQISGDGSRGTAKVLRPPPDGYPPWQPYPTAVDRRARVDEPLRPIFPESNINNWLFVSRL
jgi:hypothetical protein